MGNRGIYGLVIFSFVLWHMAQSFNIGCHVLLYVRPPVVPSYHNPGITSPWMAHGLVVMVQVEKLLLQLYDISDSWLPILEPVVILGHQPMYLL
jgi:hypothetical protein